MSLAYTLAKRARFDGFFGLADTDDPDERTTDDAKSD
jgi:hypothetical protein